MLTWLRKRMKTIMIIVAVLFALSMFYGLGYQGLKGDWGSKGKTTELAKVNGQSVNPLRYQEILGRVAANFGTVVSPQDMAFIENLASNQAIDFTLMLSEAQKQVHVSGQEVDAAIDSIMKQQKIPSKRELAIALKRIGLQSGQFQDMIRDEIMVQKLMMRLREEVRITPDDLKEFHAGHILVSTEVEAKDLLARLIKGENFAALAKQYSRDPGSATKGGDLGYFATGTMVEPFENALLALKPGELSGIVKTNFGYHIIKLLDSRMRKFNVPEKDIENTALKEKQEKVFRKWYATIREAAKIELISPTLKGHDLRFKGRVAEAITEYKKAVAQEPNNPYLHIYLGDSLLALGQKDLAFSEYENAVRAEGGNPWVYIILGKAYATAGESTLAEEQFKKASLVAGDNKAIHEQLLKIFQGMKRSVEIAREKSELNRIAKKEQFEKGLKSTN